ncbi:unnamed protein product, partial [marine sediment metagenome]
DAGTPQTITLPAGATMDGSVFDDGVALPLTILWTQQSGPGTAVFLDDSDPTTTVTFDVDGDYTLNLHADDTEFTDDDTVTITVQPALATIVLNTRVEYKLPADQNWSISGTVANTDAQELIDSLLYDAIYDIRATNVNVDNGDESDSVQIQGSTLQNPIEIVNPAVDSAVGSLTQIQADGVDAPVSAHWAGGSPTLLDVNPTPGGAIAFPANIVDGYQSGNG